MTCSSEEQDIPKAVGMVGVQEHSSRSVPVIFILRHHLCLKTPTGIQTIYHTYNIVTKKTEQSMNETVSNWLFVGQDIPKTFKKQDESKKKIIFLTGSSGLPVLVRR